MHKIDALQAALDHHSVRTVPDEPVPDEDPTPIEPVTPQPVPRTAVGAIIKVTTIPDWISKHGHEPIEFYASLGHYALLTADGPLASQIIKHKITVVKPIPPGIAEIAFDLAPGVAAELRWLNA